MAHLSRFVIVDITEPQSVPQELHAIVPTISVPIQPILESSANEYGMFTDFKKYPWVLKIYRYEDVDSLVGSLGREVITGAEAMVAKLKK